MKKINILFVLLLSIFAFTACQDDKDMVINKAAEDGTLTFKLFSPTYANSVYELTVANNSATMDTLYCNEPSYGFPASVTYTVQVSLENNFTDSTKFQDLASSIVGEKVPVNVKELNTAINTLYGDNFPVPAVATTVYVRLKAVISDATATPFTKTATVKPAYSNAIALKILPYKVSSLKFYYKAANLKPYYIIGLADGVWNNSAAGIGVSIYPLSVVKEEAYDDNGNGTFKFTGYFSAARGFKLIRDLGSWNEQWGSTDGGITSFAHNDGGSKDIKVPSDGYYTITLNSIKNTLTIEANTQTPATYSSVSIIGTFNSWGGDVALTPAESANNHIWYTTYTFSAAGQFKFRANNAWDVSWGTPSANDGDAIYTAVAVANVGGKNIANDAATYKLIINDQDGCYYVIKQ